MFRFWNPQKAFLNELSLFAATLFISTILFVEVNELAAQIVWAISAVGLIYFYARRLRDKAVKTVVDYLKPVGILIMVIYQASFISLMMLFMPMEHHGWKVLFVLAPYILAAIFIIDRCILYLKMMRRKYIILIAVASLVVMLAFLMYAFVQKAEADRQARRAEEQAKQIRALQDSLSAVEFAR